MYKYNLSLFLSLSLSFSSHVVNEDSVVPNRVREFVSSVGSLQTSFNVLNFKLVNILGKPQTIKYNR